MHREPMLKKSVKLFGLTRIIGRKVRAISMNRVPTAKKVAAA